jgi:hypothetical protein
MNSYGAYQQGIYPSLRQNAPQQPSNPSGSMQAYGQPAAMVYSTSVPQSSQRRAQPYSIPRTMHVYPPSYPPGNVNNSRPSYGQPRSPPATVYYGKTFVQNQNPNKTEFLGKKSAFNETSVPVTLTWNLDVTVETREGVFQRCCKKKPEPSPEPVNMKPQYNQQGILLAPVRQNEPVATQGKFKHILKQGTYLMRTLIFEVVN